MSELIDRFLRYVSYDTQSAEGGDVPSTKKQFALAEVLADELRAIGAQDVRLSDTCTVYAKIPSNIDRKVPGIGFIAHMDTSPDMSGENSK